MICLLATVAALTSCSGKPDSFTAEVVRLADQSEREKPATRDFEARAEALPGDSAKDIFSTAEVADEALQLFKNYPKELPSRKALCELLEKGVPGGSDYRTVSASWRRSLFNRISVKLRLIRRLTNSAKAYNWPKSKKTELGNLIVKQALDLTESPETMLDNQVEMVLVKGVLEAGILADKNQNQNKLAELIAEGRKMSQNFNERRLWRLFSIFPDERYEKYFPQFIWKMVLDRTQEELVFVRASQAKLKPVYKSILSN